jgi:hypothetical protein
MVRLRDADPDAWADYVDERPSIGEMPVGVLRPWGGSASALIPPNMVIAKRAHDRQRGRRVTVLR